MHTASKWAMILWSVFCLYGACSGIANVAEKGKMSDAEALGAGIGMFVWIIIWFFPTVGLGIIALVTRPKLKASSPESEVLCSDCGKYHAGKTKFCPHCGKEQA